MLSSAQLPIIIGPLYRSTTLVLLPHKGCAKLDRPHQIVKDYIAFSALSGRRGFKNTLKGNFAANIVRKLREPR